jgi:hypothetical protein
MVMLANPLAGLGVAFKQIAASAKDVTSYQSEEFQKWLKSS